MPRPILLFTGQWADRPLASLAPSATEWGYQGFELACWGDHLEIQSALSIESYIPQKLELLSHHDLIVPVIASHRVSQAICDPIDARHQSLLPEHVWGDGQPAKVRQRATDELLATFRVAEKLGVNVVGGFTGSPIWSYITGYPAAKPQLIQEAFQQFAKQWNAILNVARDCGVRYACEVHPGQMAFDLYSAEMVLDSLNGREEFGFTFDPAHLFWQGIDPVEFIRRFPDRIFHVHARDVALTLNGRTGVLTGLWPSGDPRRGFQYRSPGRGGLDWESIFRALNEVQYDGPIAVDWHDAGMDREYGVQDAVRFLKQIDFDPPARAPHVYRA